MAGLYSNGVGLNGMAGGAIIWKASGGSAMKAQLTQSSYSLNKETHDNRDDVTASIVTGTTDQSLTLSDPAENATDNWQWLDAADITFTAVAGGETAGSVIVYKNVGTAATDVLFAYLDFTSTVATNGSDITVTFDASDGCVTLTYGA
jgi:hypothetical protein